ncbi:MAG: hypothetical protein AABX05_00780 [Nanoarchaeota archaeon]
MCKKRCTTFSNSLNPASFNRKGQVTIFIIMGILILLALLLVIFFRKELITFKPEEIVPTEKGKIENYLTACLQGVGNDALNLIGIQGGYIDIPVSVVDDGNSRLQVSPANMIPYWARGNNVDIPSLEDIKFRMDRYIEKNMRGCMFTLQAFQESYDLIEKSDLSSDTKITDAKVLFNLRWDVEIRSKSGEMITEVIDHVSESPIKLQHVYEVAKGIVEKEMDTLKLEDITQDLISLEHPDVPVAGMELSCSKKRWDVDTVRNTLLELLRINVQQLKISGTDYADFPEDLTYYQNHYIWDLGKEFSYPAVSVLFNFDQTYPYIFAVTPLVGNSMVSSQLGGSDLLSFLCIQTWKFTYDLVYPVLVKVKDDTTGYVFNTAFTVHLIKNIASREEPVARASYFKDAVNNEDYCEVMNIPMTVFSYELVENPSTGVYDREPLDSVKTSFTCLRYRCDMLETEYDFSGRGPVSGYTTNFPYCVGGILRGEKDGYKESWQRVVTASGKEVELNLIPELKIPSDKVKIIKHQLINADTIGPGVSMKDDELGAIKLTFRKNTDMPNVPFHESSIVKAKTADTAEVELQDSLNFLAKADFSYETEVNVLRTEKFIGGYKGNWTASWEKLQGADQIVFHVISRGSASDEEMFDLLLNLRDYSNLVPAPEIK